MEIGTACLTSYHIIPKFLAQLWDLIELPIPGGQPVQVERSQNTEDGFQKIREACWCPLTSTLSRNWVAKWHEITKPSKIDLTYQNGPQVPVYYSLFSFHAREILGTRVKSWSLPTAEICAGDRFGRRHGYRAQAHHLEDLTAKVIRSWK